MCINMHKACILQRQSQVTCHKHVTLRVDCDHNGPSFSLTEVLLTYSFGVVRTKQDMLLTHSDYNISSVNIVISNSKKLRVMKNTFYTNSIGELIVNNSVIFCIRMCC